MFFFIPPHLIWMCSVWNERPIGCEQWTLFFNPDRLLKGTVMVPIWRRIYFSHLWLVDTWGCILHILTTTQLSVWSTLVVSLMVWTKIKPILFPYMVQIYYTKPPHFVGRLFSAIGNAKWPHWRFSNLCQFCGLQLVLWTVASLVCTLK